ncbi:MAG: phytanoyl-CoA dioxygenase family protein [Gammaproteobacteria bacterium]|nr:phytanoyl-CoA dioxygenase family protein [Gammaproteobacteria bacterium]
MGEALFQERVVKIAATRNHFALLTAPDGRFLRLENGATAVGDSADDHAMWDALAGDIYRHTVTGRELKTTPRADGGLDLTLDGNALGSDGTPSDVPAPFTPDHGPEQLPSEYLKFFKDHGWVCLTCVVAPELVDELQRVACTDGYADREVDRTAAQLCQSAAVAKTAAEPVSLWLTRQYMGLDEVTLGHSPAIVVLTRDDGKRNVQGWHSDYPYHWGIPAFAAVPTPSGATVLGVQRNVCVSEFTKVRGATAFKLGSHTLERPPPKAWGRAGDHGRPGYRAEHGLPYTGPEADVIEAPAGSTILYDARTWHRAGVNRTDHKRAAMLQAMVPAYVVPKNDTGGPYKEFLQSPAYVDLNERERREVRNLMVHPFPGAFRRHALIADEELAAR